MRILQLVTVGEPGGAQTVVRALSVTLAGAGDEVTIAFGNEAGSGAFEGIDGRITLREIACLTRRIDPGKDLAALGAIGRLAREAQWDVIHLHTSKAAALARLCPSVDPRRVVYTMHGYDQLKVAHRKLLLVDRALCGRTAAIVAVSEYDKTRMEADGYDARLIPNGSDDVRGLGRPQGPAAERLAALRATGRPVALLIAREAPPKRVDLLREAARLLGPTASIAWIGGAPRPEDPPNFIALGILPGASAYFRLADMALMASDHEGAPMSVLETMSAGLPMIASAVGGAPELLGIGTETPRGICVENEAEAFAEAISRLAAEEGTREALGQAGREAWEGRYSSAKMSEAYRALYIELRSRS